MKLVRLDELEVSAKNKKVASLNSMFQIKGTYEYVYLATKALEIVRLFIGSSLLRLFQTQTICQKSITKTASRQTTG